MRLPETIPTPAYVADKAAIKRNLAVATRLKDATGCKLLLATKAFALPALFPLFADALDGTTASGYYEARLGHEHFGGEVHAYSPAFDEAEIEALLPICRHIVFNSSGQLQRYAPRFRAHYGQQAVIGLRLNPQLSQVTNAALYDPSAPGCRFGMLAGEISDDLLAQIDLLHVHNLCENMAADSVALIEHLMKNTSHLLERVEEINLGGGHYMTHPGYDLDALIKALNQLQTRFDLRVTLEPGGAWVYDAGWLVCRVLDVVARDTPVAVLDISATCHMPDVLEMPYRPSVIGESSHGAYAYTLAGRTCLAGDVIGTYRFDRPLQPGDRLAFTDMLQYTLVKTTSFNGIPLPDLGVLEEDGSYRRLRAAAYKDFAGRLVSSHSG